MSDKILLTPKEIKIIQMALSQLTENIEQVSKDQTLPFTPDARKDFADMLETAKSAHAKIAAASGHLVRLDPYHEGDEQQFYTKES